MPTHGATKDVVAKFWEKEDQRGNRDGRVWRRKIPSSWGEVEYAIPETAESRQQRKQRIEASPKNTV
jgi:hypothetical protein